MLNTQAKILPGDRWGWLEGERWAHELQAIAIDSCVFDGARAQREYERKGRRREDRAKVAEQEKEKKVMLAVVGIRIIIIMLA